jgi:hypothetical protein
MNLYAISREGVERDIQRDGTTAAHPDKHHRQTTGDRLSAACGR